ncbi:hypothetical protein VTK26DRAFT_8997 [Humicola hyalothermophila]
MSTGDMTPSFKVAPERQPEAQMSIQEPEPQPAKRKRGRPRKDPNSLARRPVPPERQVPRRVARQIITEEQLKRAEELYRATYRPRHTTPIYHTLTDDAPVKGGRVLPEYILYPTQLYPRIRPGAQANGQQANESQDEPVGEDEEIEEVAASEAEESDSEVEEDSVNGANGTPGKVAAPLSQPVTPLQLPKIRPTLLLGPYDSCEQAKEAATMYAIQQGYMLIQQGVARIRLRGVYTPGAPLIRMDLACNRAGACRNVGTGKRPKSTHKLGCPARIKLLRRRRDGDKWFIEPCCEWHNHDLQPDNMESIAGYRRWRRARAGYPPESRREQYLRLRGDPVPLPPLPEPSSTEQQQPHQKQNPTQQQPPTEPTAQPPPPTSPLHMAALKGQLKILQILLDRGADANALDGTGRAALHCAIEGSHTDAVRLLVDRGADVAQPDARGLSPLRLAVERGLEEAVLLLIERGADPNR